MRPWTVVGVVLGCLAAAAVTARRLLLLVTVRGDSMRPTFEDGDRVIAFARWRWVPLRRGQVVCGPLRGVLQRSGFGDLYAMEQGLYVKRVAAGPGDPYPCGPVPDGAPERIPPGHWFLLGDNPRSADSRQWGAVPDREITAVVIAKLPQRAASSPPGGGDPG